MTSYQARTVIARNGISLIEVGGDRRGVVQVISPQQIRILFAALNGPLFDPGAALGWPPMRGKEAAARTPAQRAALSRSIRRLVEWGLVQLEDSHIKSRPGVLITDNGRETAEWLREMIIRCADNQAQPDFPFRKCQWLTGCLFVHPVNV